MQNHDRERGQYNKNPLRGEYITQGFIFMYLLRFHVHPPNGMLCAGGGFYATICLPQRSHSFLMGFAC